VIFLTQSLFSCFSSARRLSPPKRRASLSNPCRFLRLLGRRRGSGRGRCFSAATRFTRRILGPVLLLTLVLLANCSLATDSKATPNIVFILIDDLRWDALGCTGHPFAKTPNIDRIAKEGALFKNFFVSIPLCSPSRGSFLTGQYPHTHGVINNGDHSALSHKLVTFPKLLHDSGYETACIGKWHMGVDDSPRPGFDRWVSFKGQGVYNDPILNVDGKVAKHPGYITDILNDYAFKFIRSEHKKPFLLYLPHKAVHGPFTPAERHKNLYADAVIKRTDSLDDPLDGKPAVTRKLNDEKSDSKKGKQLSQSTNDRRMPENAIRNQLRALAAVDEGVGELFKALEESGQLDNTIIIFSSDNGFFWGEHGLADKRWGYDESIRDPLLIRFPRLIKPGTVFHQFILNIDIAPTLLELAGTPVPKTIQGRSFFPLLKDPETSWRASFLTEYFQEKAYPRTPTWQAVRTDRWKYISYSDLKGMDELYDLKTDPYEMKNLINDPGAQSMLTKMQAELQKLRKEAQ
jgi:arylsulfatase A-like enzyme